ncbi:DUF2218 domain-containing protein [Vibrio profundi]|uniref:DUF2218 domain-containing protein n=1 Tax=Vibrio profundi TaxID=1774960 RepID=UPI0037354D3D
MTTVFETKVEIHSSNASKYLTVLCRHFARKVSADWSDTQGVVEFPVGTSRFLVNDQSDMLTIVCSASNQKELDVQKSIIEGHVHLFSRREKISLEWQ